MKNEELKLRFTLDDMGRQIAMKFVWNEDEKMYIGKMTPECADDIRTVYPFLIDDEMGRQIAEIKNDF